MVQGGSERSTQPQWVDPTKGTAHHICHHGISHGLQCDSPRGCTRSDVLDWRTYEYGWIEHRIYDPLSGVLFQLRGILPAPGK